MTRRNLFSIQFQPRFVLSSARSGTPEKAYTYTCMNVITGMVSSNGLPRWQTPRRGHSESPSGLPTGAALALLLAAMLSGCATTGSKTYPYFDRLAIDALPPAPVEENAAVASAGELMAIGAAAGGTGTLAGGLFMSLLCGPYFLVCFAGTGAAALGGATVGAVMAGSTALSAEDTERVVSYLKDLQRTHNLSEELAAAVSARLPTARLAVPSTADARLGLEAQGLRVALGLEDTVALWVVVKVNMKWELDRPKPRQTSRSFACQAESLPLEDWLNGNKKDAEQGLSLCIDDLGLQIWTALQEPSIDPDTDSASPIGFGNYDPATGE